MQAGVEAAGLERRDAAAIVERGEVALCALFAAKAHGIHFLPPG
jgi:hypothetical protein